MAWLSRETDEFAGVNVYFNFWFKYVSRFVNPLGFGQPFALSVEAWFVYQKTNKVNVVKYATNLGLVFLFLTLPTCFPMFAVKNAALIHKTSTLVSQSLSNCFYVKVVQTTVEKRPTKKLVVETTIRFSGMLKKTLLLLQAGSFEGFAKTNNFYDTGVLSFFS